MQDYSIVLSKLSEFYSPQRVNQINDFIISLNQCYNEEVNVFDSLLDFLNIDNNNNSTAINGILDYYINQAKQQVESFYITINEDDDGDEILLYTRILNTIYLFRTYGQAKDFTICFDESNLPIQILYEIINVIYPADENFESLYYGKVSDVNLLLTNKLRKIYEERLEDEFDKVETEQTNSENRRYATEVALTERMKIFTDLYFNIDDKPTTAYKEKLIENFTGTIPLTILEDNFYSIYETVPLEYHNRLWLLIFLMKVFSDIKNKLAYGKDYSVTKSLDEFINNLNQFYVNPDEFNYVSSKMKNMYAVFLESIKVLKDKEV